MFPFILAVQIAACVLSILLLIYVLFKRPSGTQRVLMLILVTTFLSNIGYLFEMIAETQREAMIGIWLGYLGRPFLVLFTFMFVCDYAKVKLNRWIALSLAGLSSLIVVIIFTNDLHHLYYAEVFFEEGFAGRHWIVTTKGPVYWIYVGINAAYFAANIVVSIIATKHASTKREKRQLFYMYALIAVGILGYFFYLTGLTGGYDTTLTAILIDQVILSVLFFRFRIFDALSLAKDQAVEDYTDGLVILDRDGDVIYFNKAAKNLFPSLRERAPFHAEISLEKERFYHVDDRVYSIKTEPIEAEGVGYGRTFEFRNVTESYRYQENLARDVENRTKEIHRIQREVILSLANITEARDSTTGDHIKRTSFLVGAIARQLKKEGAFLDVLDERTTEMMEWAAPLHDIGKIAIPDAILLKPGRFTPDEFEVMKAHTTIGSKLIQENLDGVEDPHYVELAVNIAYCHHEKYDGTGYPRGLAGEAIPLEARVMAVADVYDALRSERPYKKGFTEEESLQILEEGRGKHFDPIVLDAFVRIVKEGETSSLRYSLESADPIHQ